VTQFRPSYSATTLNCPGSLLPSLEVADTAGYEAAVGTAFHMLIAEWLRDRERPSFMLGKTVPIDQWTVTIDREMFAYAEECIARYNLSGRYLVEHKVDISGLTPIGQQSGTADVIVLRSGVLEIIDWKYGTGVQVFAKHNTQLLCYGWGAYQELRHLGAIEAIRLHIGQPRLSHYDMWEVTPDQLREFGVWARAQWAAAYQAGAPRYPSHKACQWCRVRLRCPARQAALERIVDETFDIVDEIEVSQDEQANLIDPVLLVTPPAELSTERLAWIYQYRRSIEVWFREIGEELLKRGTQGDDLGGLWKIVIGRQGNRTWTDPEGAAGALQRMGLDPAELWTRTLASPAQVERMLVATGITGATSSDCIGLLTHRALGKPTLVPADDTRTDLTEIITETFDPE
jgi:hypothetical protein